MTKLKIYIDNDHYVGFSCKGHSDYSEYGTDIVCASISTAVQMCISYLMNYHNDNVSIVVDNENSLMELHCKIWFIEADRQLRILHNFAISLYEQYPDYFTFEILEV